jgi:hypothetical protein
MKNTETNKIELMTIKLNKLKIKEAMYVSNGYEVPQYIKSEIEVLLKELSTKK